MSRVRSRIFVAVGVVVLASMTFSAARLLRADPPTTPRSKDVANAGREVVPPKGVSDFREPAPPAQTIASGYGVVEPIERETHVAAAVAGRIARVAVREGEHVGSGDVLVELDNAVERAAADAAQADLDAASAQLARAVRGSRQEDIQAALADADTAKARAELSAGVADRLTKVQATGGATLDELDRARRQAEADAAAAKAADARAAAVTAGSRREDIQLARAQTLAAQRRLAEARAIVERSLVRAPIAGEVLQSKVRAGEYYQPGGDPLIVLGDTSKLTVRMDVDERDLANVVVGAKVVVRADAFPEQDFTGTVRELGRRMGRKNVRTDDPAQRNDTKILEAVIALDAERGLVVGQRVTCYVVK